METVTISSKFQVVLPRGYRRELGLKAGDKLVAQRRGKEITLMKVRPLHELVGTLPGPNNFVREKEDREF